MFLHPIAYSAALTAVRSFAIGPPAARRRCANSASGVLISLMYSSLLRRRSRSSANRSVKMAMMN